MPETYLLYAPLTGQTITLTGDNYRLRAVEGLGMADLKHFTEEYPQQDGESYLSTRLKKRIVSFAFQLVYETEAELWDAREDFLRMVNNIAQGVTLNVLLPNGNEREILLRYNGGLTMPRDLGQNLIQQECALQFVALNPLLYDPIAVANTYDQGDLGNWLSNDNDGSWISYPLIEITGPLTDLVIENGTTGEELDLTGYTLAGGEVVTITLLPGTKTINSSISGNLLPYLATDSDLATFHLAIDTNLLRFTGIGATANTSIVVTYRNWYVGV